MEALCANRKSITFLVVFCAGVEFGGDKKIILPPGAKPGGNHSQGILIDGTLYISGQGEPPPMS